MNHWLEKILNKNEGNKGPAKKSISIRYVVVVLAIGIGLMLFGSFANGNTNQKHEAVKTAKQTGKDQATLGQNDRSGSGPSTVMEYEHYYENQLKDALENVYGVSGVIVKVYVTTSKTKIVGENHTDNSQTTTEKDKQGGTRKITQNNQKDEPVIVNGNGKDHALIIGTEQPKISGVVVVAGGGDNPQVQLWVKEAVHSLLGVPEYRIAVLPKKMRGNEN